MKKIKEWTRAPGSERGAVLVLVAAAIVVLLGFAGLAIDVGHLMASRNEAQNVADAAALAGAGELGDQHYNEESVDENAIRAIAREVANANTVAGKSIEISDDQDIEIGYWNVQIREFSATPFPDAWSEKKNAVWVKAQRSAADNAPISTFFMKVLGRDTFSVSANATAALTGASKAPEGDLIPVGISSYWYEYEDWDDGFCNQPIQFSPTGSIEGCSGWNTFYESPSSANKLREIFEGIMDNSTSSPETSVGSEFEFTGGNVKSALCQPTQTDFEDMYNLYSDDDGNWETSVVVYEAMECENPTSSLKVLGFSTAIIHGVNCETGDAEINATVICDEYNDSRGGGGSYGTFGKIPNLVQ